MSFWTLVFLIAVMIFIYSMWHRHTDVRPFSRPADEGESARERELQSEVEQLRERIAVLERIATDPARRTAEEIEKLRDKD